MRKERNEKQTAANEMASVQETSTTATQYVEQKDAEREQTLVSEINLITEQTKQALLTGTIEIGKRLTEAKCLVRTVRRSGRSISSHRGARRRNQGWRAPFRYN